MPEYIINYSGPTRNKKGAWSVSFLSAINGRGEGTPVYVAIGRKFSTYDEAQADVIRRLKGV